MKISHEHKVYLNIKMNLTSKVNIRFTPTVTIKLYCFCTNVEFLAKCLTNLLAVLLWQTDIWYFFCGTRISHSAFINSTISVETLKMFYRNLVGKHWSEQWQGQFESNALYSYQRMQPYYRHNWEIRGQKENTDGIKSCRWCSGINRKWRENYIHVTGNREWVNNT